MKIVVTTLHSSKGETHQIDVMDGKRILHTQTATTIKQRDEIVWDLAEMYRVVDIDIKSQDKRTEKQKKQDFKYTEIPSISILSEEDAVDFFDAESDLVFTRIIKAVEEGLTMNLDSIRLFELNGTGSYLTSERPYWKDGLQRSLQYFLAKEDYLKCAEVRDLMNKL
jgi:hypothetical protein